MLIAAAGILLFPQVGGANGVALVVLGMAVAAFGTGPQGVLRTEMVIVGATSEGWCRFSDVGNQRRERCAFFLNSTLTVGFGFRGPLAPLLLVFVVQQSFGVGGQMVLQPLVGGGIRVQ